MTGDLAFEGARVARSADESARLDLTIRDGRLHFACSAPALNLEGHLVLPGLINAHDHLEFNLFPRLGRGPYPNATSWAGDIHRPGDSPVREQLQIPKSVRLWWGGIKNLVAGVTTVVHHNPYHPEVFGADFPVRVVERFGWAHSLRFSPGIAERYAATPADAPFLIHACEGSDAEARDEVYQLDSAGVLGPATVLVHGVALDSAGLALAKRRGVSLVWCPSANHFTLGRSLSREALQSGIPIALGTDSAMTAEGDLIDELRVARRDADANRLYRMVTIDAARILKLSGGEGEIRDGGVADLVVVADRGQSPAEALFDLQPEMVVIGGRIRLISEAIAGRVGSLALDGFQPLEIEGRGRWLIDGNVPQLAQPVRDILGEEFRLAGKRVAA
jgi:cytosine/adenosine deaminase-related metal-dependent hydrolase